MKQPDDSLGRDLRRIEVARRLVFHQVRTKAIIDYTNLSKNRLATLRRRWCVAEEARRRGPPPHSIRVILRDPRSRSEAAAMISLCVAFECIPGAPPSGRFTLSPLETANRLCDAFDAFKAIVPRSRLFLEELLLLMHECRQDGLLSITACRLCGCAILSSRDMVPDLNCIHCVSPKVESSCGGLRNLPDDLRGRPSGILHEPDEPMVP
jgi:hypothetical protein